MELRGEVDIAAARAQVWRALNDPDVLARCIPGCEEVRQISPTETHVRVALKMGPVRARFVGKILMEEIVEDHGCTLQFEGSGGAAGFARGSSQVKLTDKDGGTCLAYSASASIGGKLGQIGGRMIDASAKQMADQFFQALQASFVATSDTASAIGQSSAAPVALPHRASSSMRAIASADASPAPLFSGESVRVLWFALGAAATGFGVLLANFVQR